MEAKTFHGGQKKTVTHQPQRDADNWPEGQHQFRGENDEPNQGDCV